MCAFRQLVAYGDQVDAQDAYLTSNININVHCWNIRYFTTKQEYQRLYLLLREIFPKDILQEIVQTLFLRYQKIEKNVNFIHSNFSSHLQGIRSHMIINFLDGNTNSVIICVNSTHSKPNHINALNVIYYCTGIHFEVADKCDQLACTDTHVRISKGAKNIWNN